MNKFRYIMVVILKVFEWKKMFNVFYISSDKVIHSYDMISFFYISIT